MPQFQVGGCVSVTDLMLSKTDEATPAYLSEFAKDIHNEVKDRDSGYKSQFAIEMQKSVAYKRGKDNSFCDNKATMDTRKHQNGWDYFRVEGRKYLHNTGGSTTDCLQKDSETQVNKIEICLSNVLHINLASEPEQQIRKQP